MNKKPLPTDKKEEELIDFESVDFGIKIKGQPKNNLANFEVTKVKNLKGKTVNKVNMRFGIMFMSYTILFFFIALLGVAIGFVASQLGSKYDSFLNSTHSDIAAQSLASKYDITPWIVMTGCLAIFIPVIVYIIYQSHKSIIDNDPYLILWILSLGFMVGWIVITNKQDEASFMLKNPTASDITYFNKWAEYYSMDLGAISFASEAFAGLFFAAISFTGFFAFYLPTKNYTVVKEQRKPQVVTAGSIVTKVSKTNFSIWDNKWLKIASITLGALFLAIIGLDIAQIVTWNSNVGGVMYSSEYEPWSLLIVSIFVFVPLILIFFLQSKRRKFDLGFYIFILIAYLVLIGFLAYYATMMNDINVLFNAQEHGYGNVPYFAESQLLTLRILIYSEISVVAVSVIITSIFVWKTYIENKPKTY